jgi:hypothetical protein
MTRGTPARYRTKSVAPIRIRVWELNLRTLQNSYAGLGVDIVDDLVLNHGLFDLFFNQVPEMIFIL